jgi:N-formylglutamate amidohydrolase
MYLDVKTDNISISDELFDIKKQEEPEYIVAVPHSGSLVPLKYMPLLNYDQESFIDGIDIDTDKVYSLCEHKGVVIISRLHRYITDLNRGLSIDPNLDIGNFGPEEVIREFTFDNKKIWRYAVSNDITQQLISQYYTPYETLLRYETDQIVDDIGFAFILNGHSMKDEIPLSRRHIETSRRPAFCIGLPKGTYTQINKDIAKFFIESFMENIKTINDLLKGFEYQVKINSPYDSGEDGTICSRFGEPRHGTHSLLLEVNESIYDNEKGKARQEIIDLIKDAIGETSRETVEMGKRII